MTKTELLKTVEDMMNAGSCCPELKEKAQAYLDDQNENTKAELLAEIAEDITTIDSFIGFLGTDIAKNIFGGQTDATLDAAKAHKAKGGQYCLCDACQNAAVVLAHKDVL